MSLELRRVSAGYQGVNAIAGIDLEVKAGEIVALLGANGAGKSTLLKTISGLLPLSSGNIVFRGRETGRLSTADRVRAGIAHVPEGRQIFPGMTVAENLALGGYARQAESNAQAKAMVLQSFPALTPRLQAVAGNLSGGQQQMLAIGRGLMGSPGLLLLDEPSLGLAPKLVGEIFTLISNLKTKGISILLSEQNARLALAIADRGYVLENGRIVLEGQGQSLLHSREVAEKYLGVGAAQAAEAKGQALELGEKLLQLLNSPL